MQSQIVRNKGRLYLLLPEDFPETGDADVMKLKDGLYLVDTSKTPQPQNPKTPSPSTPQISITDPEKKVVKRLLSIRFEKRTPPYVEEYLTPEEFDTLRSLELRKIVTMLKSQKYPQGVYNIEDKVYAQIMQNGPQVPPAHPQNPPTQPKELLKDGFGIFESYNDAKQISNDLDKEIKSGNLVGIKGFDGRYYVGSRKFIDANSPKVLGALEKDQNLESIVKETKLDPNGCLVLIRLLAENGDIIEKKKGMFARA
ncbi:MAG: hypothetical protein ACP5NX_01290 [Candidatus Bilamarchaeaceae archaeon]